MSSLTFDEAKISATLHRATSAEYVADDLVFNMWIYEDGIARVAIEEPDSGRFRVSQEPILTEGIDLTLVKDVESLTTVNSFNFVIEGTTTDG